MAVVYLDTSAFVKRYKTEAGTEVIDTLFESLTSADRVTTSIFGILEFFATCRRLLKANEIDAPDFQDMAAHFVRDIEAFYIPHPVDDDLLAKPLEVIAERALRTTDSVHLVAALEIQELLSGPEEAFVFVADDDELCQAARSAKLEVINPREEQASQALSGYLGQA